MYLPDNAVPHIVTTTITSNAIVYDAKSTFVAVRFCMSVISNPTFGMGGLRTICKGD
jgi:hypothetical protein